MQITGSGYDSGTVTLTPQGQFNGFTWWEGTAMQYDEPSPVSFFVGNGMSGLGTGTAGIWVSPFGSLEPSVYMNMACYGSDIPIFQCTQTGFLFCAADAGGPEQVTCLYGTSPNAVIWDEIPTTLLVTASGDGGAMPPVTLTRTVPCRYRRARLRDLAGMVHGVLQWQLDYGISTPLKWTLNGLFVKANLQGTPVSYANGYGSAGNGNFDVVIGET